MKKILITLLLVILSSFSYADPWKGYPYNSHEIPENAVPNEKILKHYNMENEMRKMIDKVKNFGQFVNENKKNEWTQEIQKEFDEWKRDGNVSKNKDGSYSTQDAQWKNKLKDLEALKQYYMKEFLN